MTNQFRKSDAFKCAATDVQFVPAPIKPEWLIAGAPVARNAILSQSEDGWATTMAWDCTAGRFNWHFTEDETVHIVSGEVLVLMGDRPPCVLRAGDVAFFPAGSHAVWQVDDYVRKVAFCRIPVPKFARAVARPGAVFAKLARLIKR